MCGRFALDIDNRFYPRFKIKIIEPLVSRFNVSPGPDVPVIINDSADKTSNKITKMRWGLVPVWLKDSEKKYKLINAKVETVTEKPIFKDALVKRRCIVPASGFFEWQTRDSEKVPYYIFNKSKDYMALAGIYEAWQDENNKPVVSFAIITSPANKLLLGVHPRMPVVLEQDEENLWLDASVDDAGVLNTLLDPYPENLLDLYEVSTAVNYPENNSRECIMPVNP